MGRLTGRVAVLVLAVALVTGGAALTTGAVSTDTGTTASSDAPAERTGLAADAGTLGNHTAGNDSAAERLACVNGTSEAVVACGYNGGPTAVSLADQETDDGNVTVEAVELEDGGFVAIHRVSFVDGAFTESVVGVSDPLEAGLHRDVQVALDSGLAPEQQFIAVVYRDSDDDGSYDFVATDGADDRPYTNTYSERAGNVTDEAGDVLGDVATVSAPGPIVNPGGPPAGDVDDDSQLEDFNGDGELTLVDVAILFENRNGAAVRDNPDLFDFNGDGRFSLVDVGLLFQEATG